MYIACKGTKNLQKLTLTICPARRKNFNNWAENFGLAPDENVMIAKLPGPDFLAYWGYIKVTL